MNIPDWLTVFSLFVLIGLVIWSIIKYFEKRDILQHGDLVEGRVIEHSQGDEGGSFIKYRYEYRGETYTKTEQVNWETSQVIYIGKRIYLRCLPDNPKKARLDIYIPRSLPPPPLR